MQNVLTVYFVVTKMHIALMYSHKCYIKYVKFGHLGKIWTWSYRDIADFKIFSAPEIKNKVRCDEFWTKRQRDGLGES